ncbi:hypothetical protein MKL26_07075 [Streptococcus suis]|nr:hypothetical protein [Streptococcus suis]
MKDYSFYTVFIPYLVIVIILHLIRYLFAIAMTDLLYSLEFTKYVNYIHYAEKKMNKNGSLKNYYLFRVAQYKYYSGHFDECITLLKEIDISTFKYRKYVNYDLLDFYFLAYNARIRLDELEKLNNIEYHIQHIPVYTSRTKYKKNIYLKQIKFIREVLLENKENDFYANKQPNSKLESILINYYQGLNGIVKNDKAMTHKYFKNIEHESDFLFAVREAKEWLDKTKAD